MRQEIQYLPATTIEGFSKQPGFINTTTGTTFPILLEMHIISVMESESPYGPFTYQGVILNPVIGWTNHHSIVEFNGEWYLFYHDTEISGGQTHLRNINVTLTHRADGTIATISPYLD